MTQRESNQPNDDEETARRQREEHDAHRDPLTRDPGSHPLATAAGSATGAIAGAALGSAVAGPAGTLVGGAIGAIAGAAAGHTAAERANPTREDAYWRDNFQHRSYVRDGSTYDDYQPAFRYGWEAQVRNGLQNFDDVESDLERGWDQAKGRSRLNWCDARPAARDAWERMEKQSDGLME